MFQRLAWLAVGAARRGSAQRCNSTLSTKKVSDPLRILFCGSDDFSCRSLEALHKEHVRNPALVQSMEVMVRPPKSFGRGYKQLREVPCQVLAEKLDLKTHQQDTFKGWQLPNGINLIIAVSFGLFVPPRILSAAKYGGLNVHPSLLPDLRGPAPVQHALLRGDTHTGVSLQTLDSQTFDHGAILAQTPSPGLLIPPEDNVQELIVRLGTVGADMLLQGLRDGVHVPPHEDVGWKAEQLGNQELMHAPKVTKADAEVDWDEWTAEVFARRMRVFGSVWSQVVNSQGEVKRIILVDAKPVADEEVQGTEDFIIFTRSPESSEEQYSMLVRIDDKTGSCFIQLRNKSWIRIESAKVEGKKQQRGSNAFTPFMG